MLPDLSHEIIADRESIKKRNRYLRRVIALLVLGLATVFAFIILLE